MQSGQRLGVWHAASAKVDSTMGGKVWCAAKEEERSEEKEDELNIENIEIDSNNNIEDDTVLIEEESDVDPAVDVGIKTTEDNEEEY